MWSGWARNEWLYGVIRRTHTVRSRIRCGEGGWRAYAAAVCARHASLPTGCLLVACLAGCATHVTPAASTVTIPDLRNPCDGGACATATPASYPTNAAALPTLGLETLAGELGRANNTWEASRRHAILHVVVPEGLSLASTVVCRGARERARLDVPDVVGGADCLVRPERRSDPGARRRGTGADRQGL